jgi:hypothetical protein
MSPRFQVIILQNNFSVKVWGFVSASGLPWIRAYRRKRKASPSGRRITWRLMPRYCSTRACSHVSRNWVRSTAIPDTFIEDSILISFLEECLSLKWISGFEHSFLRGYRFIMMSNDYDDGRHNALVPFLPVFPLGGCKLSLGCKRFNCFRCQGQLDGLLKRHTLRTRHNRHRMDLTVMPDDRVIPMATVETARYGSTSRHTASISIRFSFSMNPSQRVHVMRSSWWWLRRA